MKAVLFANSDWYLYNFRLNLAAALCDAGHQVLLVSPPGPYGEKLQALGFRWIAAPMRRRSLNPFSELGLVLWLWNLLRRERADLVHGFTIKCAVYGSLAGRLAGVPARVSAVTGMGYVFTSDATKARLLRPLVRAVMRMAFGGPGVRLILQNADDKKLVEQAGIVEPATVRLIAGSGVDCRRFSPDLNRARASIALRFRVLLASRMLWDKGIQEFIDAARQLRAEHRDIDFLLAGAPDPGNPASIPETTLRAWVEEGLVQWLGHVDDMPALFHSVDAVVLPSYREGLPKGLVEAAACGLPLVTTDAPGCREVVTPEVDGLLVPVRDSVALARAIARLQDDPSLAARLGAAARAKALANFDARIIVWRTIDVYRELSQKRKRQLWAH